MNEIGLGRIAVVLRRRWLLIVSVLVVVVALGIARSVLSDSTYTADVELTVLESTVDDPLDLTPDRNVERALEQELRVLGSEEVDAAVVEAIGSDDWSVELDSRNPDLLIVDASANDPDLAAEVANTYAEVFITSRLTETITRLEGIRAVVVDRIAAIQTEIDELEARLVADPTDTTADLLIGARVEQLGVFVGRLDELDFRIANATGGIAAGTPAVAPSDPTSGTLTRDAILALMVGAVLAAAAAAAREAADDRLWGVDEAQEAIGDTVLLGTLPGVDRPPADVDEWLAVAGGQTHLAESLRGLRASVFHGLTSRRANVLQVTSTHAGDDVQMVVSGLGTLFARLGFTVAIIEVRDDAELTDHPGLLDVINGRAQIAEVAVRAHPQVTLDRLRWRSATEVAPELLGSQSSIELVRSLTATYDYVLIDSPPVLTDAAAATVAGVADATVLLAAAGQARVRDVDQALETMEVVGAEVLGVVLVQSGHDPSLGRSSSRVELPPPATPDGEASTNGHADPTDQPEQPEQSVEATPNP